MTGDPYQAYPSPYIGPQAVQLIAAGPVRQRRLTVAFRVILVIPHLFALFFLGIAGLAVVFVGWWAALFAGRLPAFAVDFISGWVRWSTLVNGYLYLLTDRYPPFAFSDDPAYPVRVAIPERHRLNRFAVFFRLVLMVWACIVSSLVNAGAGSIVLVIAWLITLITGKLPAPLHLAFTAVLRYQTRFSCYLGLLTPTYAWKLFGDEPGIPAVSTATPPEAVPLAGSAWGTPPGDHYGYGYGTPESVYGAPGGYDSALTVSEPADWRLVLPRSAKALLIVFIVIGLATNGVNFYRASQVKGRVTLSMDWNSANNTLNASLKQWVTSSGACGQNVTCLTQADSRAAASMSAFAGEIEVIAVPPAYGTAERQVVADARKVAQDLTVVSHTTNITQYETATANTFISLDFDRFTSDLNSLVSKLNRSRSVLGSCWTKTNDDAQYLPLHTDVSALFLLLSRGLCTTTAQRRKRGTLLSSDPYQAYPSFPAGAPLQLIEEPAVQLIAAGPAKQRRLTVAFRLILAIPHFLALLFLFIGGFVVAFLGWWGALFTGRLPGFAVSYLSGLAHWYARVSGYMYLLTDVYPPFTLDAEPGYPVVIALPEQGRLNRVAVFFRFILLWWAYLVLGVVSGGANSIVLFIAWLITLITGKLPTPLHQAYTAVLRYQTRYYCYSLLLTSTYPWKLLGDAPDTSVLAPTAPAPAAPGEAAWDIPSGADTTEGYGAQPGYGATPAYGTAPGYATPQSAYGTPAGYGGAQPGGPVVSWPLVLSKSAKNLLILFIVLGVIFDVGGNIVSAIVRNNTANSVNAQANAVAQWNSAADKFNTKMTAWSTSESACQTLTCATHGAAEGASYVSAFASQVRGIAMPTTATSTTEAKIVADATRSSADLTTLSKDTTVAQLQADEASSGLSKDLDALQSDINSLANALNALNASAAS